MSETIKLTHPFVNQLPDVDALFFSDNEHGHITTINNFCHKVNTMAERHANCIDPNMFKGNALEMLVEFLIKAGSHDNRIGIYDYHTISDEDMEDTGVDGYGIGENKNPATVQVKFRSGDYILRANEDHLSNFLTSSWVDFNVPIEDDKNMLIVTTGLKVDDATREKMLKNKVRILNRDDLRSMLDNRPEWWNRFWDSVKASRTVKETLAPLVLRKHQKEAIEAVLNDEDGKGKIILPTGTGKTNIQAEIIRLEIESLMAKGVTPLIKVNSSRILLCFQLFEEYYKYLAPYLLNARYVNFNSGNSEEKYFAQEMRKSGGIFRSILSTTSIKQVEKLYEQCKKEHVPLILLSTYHSSCRFKDSLLVPDLTIHDEAHNLVSKEFNEAAKLPSLKQYSFTATMRVTDSGMDLGMNNESIFGNLVYSKSARELIECGEMVPPYIHIVKAKNMSRIDVEKVDADYEALFSSIVDSFFAHEKKIKEECCIGHQNNVGPKILVACRGQQELIEMFKTKAYEKFRILFPKINTYALSSEFGLRINDKYYPPPVTNNKKYKLLKAMKALGSSECCIAFHVDMFTEGIDVPGITGVMPFRNCEMAKFVQNIGRSSRLNPIDRKNLYSGIITTEDRSKWIKPKSWIIIPSFMANSEGFVDRFRKILWDLRTEFGFIPEEHTLIDNDKGFEDDKEIDTVNENTKVKKHTKSGMDGFEHEFEETTFLEKLLFDHKLSTAIDKSRGLRDSEIAGTLSCGNVNDLLISMGIKSEF